MKFKFKVPSEADGIPDINGTIEDDMDGENSMSFYASLWKDVLCERYGQGNVEVTPDETE